MDDGCFSWDSTIDREPKGIGTSAVGRRYQKIGGDIARLRRLKCEL
jgi:hypothetical protein